MEESERVKVWRGNRDSVFSAQIKHLSTVRITLEFTLCPRSFSEVLSSGLLTHMVHKAVRQITNYSFKKKKKEHSPTGYLL